MIDMEILEKLRILSDAAKYDSACTSSGSDRKGKPGQLGSAVNAGICHSFTSDGRCVSLLKVLQTNICAYDCKYCANRRSNDVPRAAFTPEELSELTIQFYRRNYIEGLFLSSAVLNDPDYTTEMMLRTLTLLRKQYRYNGYIHAKCIPGADPALIAQVGAMVDRISVNIELPSETSLTSLAPEKSRNSILKPMGFIAGRLKETKSEALVLRNAQAFAPAGHATQMIIGATPDTDLQIIRLSEGLYNRYQLKRVFYSAFLPAGADKSLAVAGPVPLLREHRLYQADWLLRFYGFSAGEILDERNPNFNVFFDPKCDWALRHLDLFPVEIMRADKEALLRVPGLGVRSVERIIAARRSAPLSFEALKRMGAVMKRAQYFITVGGKTLHSLKMDAGFIAQNLLIGHRIKPDVRPGASEQLSMLGGAGELLALKAGGTQAFAGFGSMPNMLAAPAREAYVQSLTGEL